MNCCSTETRIADLPERDEPPVACCYECNGQSRPVSRRTVLLMLKPHLLELAMKGTFSFCAVPACPVVYFEERGIQRFTVNDLRIEVGVKAGNDPISLCYCFGFDQAHIRDEISRTGSTTVPERIAALIREGLCACDTRNPAGVCCLGEVNKAVKRIQKEAKT